MLHTTGRPDGYAIYVDQLIVSVLVPYLIQYPKKGMGMGQEVGQDKTWSLTKNMIKFEFGGAKIKQNTLIFEVQSKRFTCSNIHTYQPIFRFCSKFRVDNAAPQFYLLRFWDIIS